MPREMTLTSTAPVSLPVLVQAGTAVDGSLVPRTLFGGWALQLVDVDDVAVLTIELSRPIEDPWDAERLIGASVGPGQREAGQPGTGQPGVGGELWWTEATAPWGPVGEPGVRIVRQLAELMSARLIVEEGT